MLNDTKCRNAKAQARPYKLTDANGLYLEVKPNGVKAWRYRFELVRDGQRKENVFAIGEYVAAPVGETPEQAAAPKSGGCFTLAEAREKRGKARTMVKQGINPAYQRQLSRITREQQNATTFEAISARVAGAEGLGTGDDDAAVGRNA